MSAESAPGEVAPPLTEEEGALGQTSQVPVVPEEPPRRQIVLPEDLPAGAQPIFLSSVTQKLFKLEADVDVTEEHPDKTISKKVILEDIFNRAAVSDFQPLKKQIEHYSAEALLLLYDIDFKFGQNFVICLSKSAMESILAVPIEEETADKGETLGEVAEGEEGIEGEVLVPSVTPPPRGPWVSLGSEKEIEDWKVVPTRPRLRQRIWRKRNKFNQPFFFSDRSCEERKDMYTECESSQEPAFSLKALQTDKAVQAIPGNEESHSQTTWAFPKNATVQYSARDTRSEDSDCCLLNQFILRHIDMLELCLQQNLISNIFIDDYLRLNAEGDSLFSVKTDNSLKEYQSFTDLQFSKDKTITCLDWHPTVRGLLAVSCAYSLSFDRRIDAMHHITLHPSRVLIWSFVDPIHPMLMLEAPEDVMCFKFNPVNPNIIVGGCINGFIVLWDISQWEDRLMANRDTSSGSQTQGHVATSQAIFDTEEKLNTAPVVRYCARSSIEHGHKNMVTDIQWVPAHMEISRERDNLGAIIQNQTHTCDQIVSSSLDGMVYFWDTRPLPSGKEGASDSDPSLEKRTTDIPSTFLHLDTVWKPFLYASLPRGDNPGDFGATRMSFKERHNLGKAKLWRQEIGKSKQDKSAGESADPKSSKFYVGTEDGEIVCTDWVPIKDGEGRFTPQRPEVSFTIHSGIVTSLNRSPFFSELVLSVGGWTFCLWKEGLHQGPIFESSCSDVRRLSGCWSPSRPGVFFIGRTDGYLEVWDLMDRSHEPIMKQNVSSSALTALEPLSLTKDLMLLAIGDSNGTLSLLQIPWSLRHPSSSEVSLMESYWERAEKALIYRKEREEVREREVKQIHADSFSQKSDVKQTERATADTEIMYEEFLDLEHRLLKQLGLIPDEDQD